jgi:hypothetical protein
LAKRSQFGCLLGAALRHTANNTLLETLEATMKPIANRALKNLPVIVMLLFAALSFAVVVDARDPVGFLAWLFCFAAIMTAGNSTPAPAEIEIY